MEFLKELSGAEGKTVARVVEGFDYSALVFSDDTCVILRAKLNYGDSASIAIEHKPDINEQLRVGAITKDEYDVKMQKIMDWSRSATEAQERALYEQLKKKFETK